MTFSTVFNLNHRIEPDKFNPYEYLARVGGEDVGEPVMLSDQFRASDLGDMLKTALRAIELLSDRVKELEKAKSQ